MMPLRTFLRPLIPIASLCGFAVALAPVANSAESPQSQAAADPRWSLIYTLENSNPATQDLQITEFGSLVPRAMLPPTNSPDVAVKPSTTVTQSEISVAVHPTNPDFVFVSATATPWPVTTVYGTGVSWSTNGGTTWAGDDHGPGGVGNSGDPAACIRASDNRMLVGYISSAGGMGVDFSTNFGATWQHRIVSTAGSQDKNHLHVDNSPASPFVGNVYNAWSNLGSGASANDIVFSRSTNGGDTWSSVVDISAAVASGSHDQGVNLRTSRTGTVYACWSIYDSFPSDETAIGLNRSTDGGATWTGAFRAITNIRGHRNTTLPNTTSVRRNSFPSMAVDVSGGPHDGTVYVCWTNIGVPGINTGTDASIYVARSTNGGSTFQTAVKVNQDTGTASQFFPWVACDPLTGQVSVVFFDRRDDPSNTQARAYMAVSNDAGLTFEDFPVGDVSFTPTPIPGLAGGYMGDYLGIDFTNGRAYPAWTDNRTGNFLCYTSPILVSDPTDPNAPTNAAAVSDYTTPNTVALSWTDPTTYVSGTPLGDFSIDILRDDVFLVNVDQGTGLFNDGGLTDGQAYSYTLRAHDDVTDSLSVPVSLNVFAGGSPTPAAPTGAGTSATPTDATITWTNPTRQSDGTLLDDFAGVRIFRNGSLLIELARAQADTGSADNYLDTPPPGFVYQYEVAAIDNETPVHQSTKANAGSVFVGDVPAILVWHPSDVLGTSAESIFAACQALGESVFLTDNLFEFSPDLTQHEIVIACLGIYSDNHVLTAVEGSALDTFTQNGGRLYVEGSDCFNFDTTYNILPIFGLADGPDGTGDLFGLTGLNDLAGFSFTYAGGNNFIDELQPITSTPIWKNSGNTDIVGVFNAGYGAGAGRAIGASYEFGGLVDVPSAMVTVPASHDVSGQVLPDAAASEMAALTAAHGFKPRAHSGATFPVVKRWANLGHPRAKRTEIPGGMAGALQGLRMANTKIDVMDAYLTLFRATGNPVLVTSTASVTSEVFQGFTDQQFVTVSNPGTLNQVLNYTVTETPDVGWLTVSPLAGALNANGSQLLTIDLDSGVLAPGLYETDLVIDANDPVNPQDIVHVAFTVNGVPVAQLTPSSVDITLAPLGSTTQTLTLTNAGNGDLTYDLTAAISGGAERFELGSEAFSQLGANLSRGDVYRVDTSIPLKAIEMRLNPSAATAMEFFVYENTAATGTFTKILSAPRSAGPGLAWYSSGPINVTLQAGKFYYIGAAWAGNTRFYNDFGTTPPLPLATPFGAVMGPGFATGYPPPGSVSISAGTFLFSMALEYGDIVDIAFLDPSSGTVPASSSTDIDVQFTAAANEGVFTGSFDLTSNDPFTGTLSVPLSVTVTSGTDAPIVAAPVPTKLALYASAPNPFRGATVIRYDLPRPGKVSLRVFDVSGRLVRTLVEGEEPAGYRAITWDGLDDTGRRSSAGVYFYALEANDQSFRKKMIQLR